MNRRIQGLSEVSYSSSANNDVPDGVFLLPVDRANTDGTPRSLSTCSDSPLKFAKLARAEGRGSIVHPGCTTPVHCRRKSSGGTWRRNEPAGKRSRTRSSTSRCFKSQIPFIDKSRGYSLEMICTDFLAGANLDKGSPEILLHSIQQFFKFLPGSINRHFWNS